MRQFLLATALVLGAIGLFVGGRAMLGPDRAQPLGDLQAMQTIVSDVQAIVGTGDLSKAETRITDLETAWDEAEPTLRPKDPEAWGRVDEAADAVLSALRRGTPDAAAVDAALVTLTATLADPAAAGAASSGVVLVGEVPVTDGNGHPLPCEAMLAELNGKLAATTMTPEAGAAVGDLVAKAMERCNADDDRNANAFSAQALQMVSAT